LANRAASFNAVDKCLPTRNCNGGAGQYLTCRQDVASDDKRGAERYQQDVIEYFMPLHQSDLLLLLLVQLGVNRYTVA